MFDFNNNVDYYIYKYPYYPEEPMRTIQMTLDDELVETVDMVVKKLKTTLLLSPVRHCRMLSSG